MCCNPIILQYNTANADERFYLAPFNKIARAFVLIG